MHSSGFAIPLAVLGFGAAWVGPVLTAVVAGDIFSSEDRFGTWKTILTRAHSRGQLFAGKFLAALTFALTLMVLATGRSWRPARCQGTICPPITWGISPSRVK